MSDRKSHPVPRFSMHARAWLLSLILSGLLTVPSPAQRPEPPRASGDSHGLLPGQIDRTAAERFLSERLRQSSEILQTQGMLELLLKNPERYGLSRKTLEKLAGEAGKNPEELGIDPRDPRWQEMAKRLARDQKLDPENLDQLKKMIGDANPPEGGDGLLKEVLKDPERFGLTKKRIEDMAKQAGKDPGGFDPKDPKWREMAERLAREGKFNQQQLDALKQFAENRNRPDPVRPPEVERPQEVPRPGDPVRPPQAGAAQDPVRPPDQLRPPMGEGASDGSSPFSGRNSDSMLRGPLQGLTDSPLSREVRQSIRGWFRGKLRRGLGSRGAGRSARSLLPRFKSLGLDRLFKNAPSVRMPRPNVNVSLGSPSVGGGAGNVLGHFLILLLVAGALGILFYMVTQWKRERAAREARGEIDRWKLGGWPVAPGNVRNRGELVLAFEYLALLLLGRKAAVENHQQIADDLGAAGGQTEAAQEVARLYEHARYAPPDEMLSPEEIAVARRDLSLLAGVPAA
jgi:hypothetical protein